MAYTHIFHYADQADFIAQLDAMLTKLLSGASEMEPYSKVRERYPHLNPTAFCTRLSRFKGEFPHELGESGKRIVRLFVTRELDACLRKGARTYKKQPNQCPRSPRQSICPGTVRSPLTSLISHERRN